MGRRIVTSAVEHKAVLESCLLLDKFGFEILVLPVDRYGRVDPDELTGALSDSTILVSLQLANNEVGTLQPVAELVARVRAGATALIHLDAVGAAAQVAIDVSSLGADLVSLAAHKLEGPAGIGALWVRRGTAILPQVHGGSQERYRRAGTENVAAAVGMAAAFELAGIERATMLPDLASRRDGLRTAVLAIEDVELTGHPTERLPGSLSVIVRGLVGDELVMALDLEGVACSTGSACTTGSMEPSHVLTAMGYPPSEARGALRFTLGRRTSDEDVMAAGRVVRDVIGRLRESQSEAASLGVGGDRAGPDFGDRAGGGAGAPGAGGGRA
jgi:cysteine desulfurase